MLNRDWIVDETGTIVVELRTSGASGVSTAKPAWYRLDQGGLGAAMGADWNTTKATLEQSSFWEVDTVATNAACGGEFGFAFRIYILYAAKIGRTKSVQNVCTD